jgi:hypothetical protein
MITPEMAAENAANTLDTAAALDAFPEMSAALVDVADGWMRLHTALANAPKTIEPAPTVNIEGLAVKDVDPKQIAEYVARAMGHAPKPEPEISVYSERARLVAYLARQYPAVLAYDDPDEPDWPVIYITTPAGQLSWHIAPDDVWLFAHVPWNPRGVERLWDGHTTAEKYERLALLVQDEAQGQGPA